MRKVDHRLAFEWDCPDCDTLNYASGITLMMSEEDRIKSGVPEDMPGDFVAIPNVVKCSHCGSEFETSDEESEL